MVSMKQVILKSAEASASLKRTNVAQRNTWSKQKCHICGFHMVFHGLRQPPHTGASTRAHARNFGMEPSLQ